ncbi:hypothetical protein K9M16_04595 [Candidatus Babeliales bacterium]|nr:hypothetical protein [Candidatus Babeliales bacterium]
MVVINFKNAKLFFSILLIILLIPACAYQPKKISVQKHIDISYQETQNNIDLDVKYVDNSENKSYFSNFVPLQIQIKNKSDKIYVIKSDNISLPIATIKELKKRVPKLFVSSFVPTAALAATGIFFWWQACLPLAAASAVVGAILGDVHNQKTKKQLDHICMCQGDKFEIEPEAVFCKLIFIEKDNYCPNFELKIFEKDNNNELIFKPLLVNKTDNLIYKFEI